MAGPKPSTWIHICLRRMCCKLRAYFKDRGITADQELFKRLSDSKAARSREDETDDEGSAYDDNLRPESGDSGTEQEDEGHEESDRLVDIWNRGSCKDGNGEQMWRDLVRCSQTVRRHSLA